jgi:hypothetical protein
MHGSSSFVSSLHRLWLISLVCAFTLATATRGAGADEIDDYIRLQQQKWHIPGVGPLQSLELVERRDAGPHDRDRRQRC